MKTVIRTAHEEAYNQNDKKRTLGVLINYSTDGEFNESFVYIYKNSTYVIFNTIIEMIDYLLYGDMKMKRAYMKESYFDELYDNEFNDTFNSKLEWVTN